MTPTKLSPVSNPPPPYELLHKYESEKQRVAVALVIAAAPAVGDGKKRPKSGKKQSGTKSLNSRQSRGEVVSSEIGGSSAANY